MNFETEAYIEEYVIDGKNTGTFAGDEANITYSPENQDMSSPVSIPTDKIDSIIFRRDTSLLRNRFLGWFFAAVTLVLMFILGVFSVGAIKAGMMDRNMMFLGGFLLMLVLGGISTTYEYFNDEEYDVVVILIETEDAESHIFAQRIKNTNFVESCHKLIESDIETENQNKRLEAELVD